MRGKCLQNIVDVTRINDALINNSTSSAQLLEETTSYTETIRIHSMMLNKRTMIKFYKNYYLNLHAMG